MAYIMCKWCYGTGYDNEAVQRGGSSVPCHWCYGTGCDRQATEKAGMTPPTGFAKAPVVYDWTMPPPKPVPTYKATELDKMPESSFADLAARVKREMERRTMAMEGRKLVDIGPEDRTGFRNFLRGVTHAMACRQALRMSKGHKPFGPTPQSGEMWTAQEGNALARMVHEDRGTVRTNPLDWDAKGTDMDHWLSGKWATKGIASNPYSYAANRAYGY